MRNIFTQIPWRLFLIGFALAWMLSFVLGPFVWQFVTALKPESQLAKLPPLIPDRVTWRHFATVLTAPDFLRICWNSILVAVGTILAGMLLGIPASYALTKLGIKGSRVMLALLLCLAMFPPIANVAPLYLLFTALGLRDHVLGIIIAHTVFTLPFLIWTLSSFLREIPDELYQAARIDGCSHWGVVRHIVLPLAVPGMISAGMLVFLLSWNEFLYAFTLSASERSRTLPVAIALFPGVHEFPWGEIAAAAILASLPGVLLMLFFQRWMVSGLTAGSVKG